MSTKVLVKMYPGSDSRVYKMAAVASNNLKKITKLIEDYDYTIIGIENDGYIEAEAWSKYTYKGSDGYSQLKAIGTLVQLAIELTIK